MRYNHFILRGKGVGVGLFFAFYILSLVFVTDVAAQGPGPGIGPGPGPGPGHRPATGGYLGPGSGPAGPAFPYGSYTGPGPALATVTQAMSMNNRDWVVLNGTISQSLGGNRYMFTDSTGTIEVDIGPKEWMWVNRPISASDPVEIQGDIHNDWNRPYNHVHVKRLLSKQ